MSNDIHQIRIQICISNFINSDPGSRSVSAIILMRIRIQLWLKKYRTVVTGTGNAPNIIIQLISIIIDLKIKAHFCVILENWPGSGHDLKKKTILNT